MTIDCKVSRFAVFFASPAHGPHFAPYCIYAHGLLWVLLSKLMCIIWARHRDAKEVLRSL